jgi:hypothetical protein
MNLEYANPVDGIAEPDAEYWYERLSGLDATLVPGDVTTAQGRPVRGNARFEFPEGLHRKVRASAAAHGESPFMVTLAAFYGRRPLPVARRAGQEIELLAGQRQGPSR